MQRRTAVLVTAVVLLACYAPVLRGMIGQWSTDEDMSHGFAVPFVVAWVVWRERERWRKLEAKPSAWGWVLLAMGAMMQVAGALGVGLFAGSLGLLISITGAVVCLGGFVWLRALAFPLVLSLFMLP